MNDYDTNYQYGVQPGSMNMAVDQGLRSFMLGVYNKMGLGLVWSGLLAAATNFVEPLKVLMFGTPLGMVVSFAPVVILLLSGFMMKNPSAKSTGILYWTIVTLMGLSLGVWGLVYQLNSLITVFFVTASAFGALSLFGYTTKKDLSGLGSFLIMAVFGLIIAMIVNMFLQNSTLDLIISGAGVLIFSGLIAFRTQNLKYQYYAFEGNHEALGVATNYGALSLYIDFINLFQFLLRILGSRR